MRRRTTRPAHNGRWQQGFTLIEVLVSLLLFAVMVGMTGMVITAIRLNGKSRDSLNVNQSVNAYLDGVYASWQNALMYRNGTLPTPPTLPGQTWKLTLQTVDVLSGTPSNTTTFTQGSAVGGYDHDEPLKRLILTYRE